MIKVLLCRHLFWFVKRVLRNFLLSLDFECKGKARALSMSRLKLNSSIILLHDHLGYHQSKSDSILVHLVFLRVLHEPEQFKKFAFVLLGDSDTCVFYRYF